MMKCDIIVMLLLCLSSISIVHSYEKCCKTGNVRTSSSCEDGSPILTKCDGSRNLLNNAWSFYSMYTIGNDSVGDYLDNYLSKYIIRSPHFCVGIRKRVYKPYVSDEVAIICSDQREHYSDLKFSINFADHEEAFFSYFTLFDIFLNFLSSLLLAVAFYVYYLEIPFRQIEDDCLLNVAGSLTLSHVAFLYDTISEGGVLPDLCITNLYFMYYFTLSGFIWYALFMYYLWKKYKIGVSLEQAAILKQFRIIGYGAPALLMILVNIHAHATKLYSLSSFEFDCMSHQILIEDIYVFAPLLLAVGSNCFFWKSLEKYSETIPIKSIEDSSNRSEIDRMLTLNRRLYFALGLPWLAFIIINGTNEVFQRSIFASLGLLTEFGTSCVGCIVALILVMSRARVWKCVTYKYENYEWLKKWQPSDQEMISTLCDRRKIPSDV